MTIFYSTTKLVQLDSDQMANLHNRLCDSMENHLRHRWGVYQELPEETARIGQTCHRLRDFTDSPEDQAELAKHRLDNSEYIAWVAQWLAEVARYNLEDGDTFPAITDMEVDYCRVYYLDSHGISADGEEKDSDFFTDSGPWGDISAPGDPKYLDW